MRRSAGAKTGLISMEKLVELMVINPRKRFNIPMGNDYSLWELEREYEVKPEDFASMGKATPFEGMKVFGRCVLTVCGGNVVYKEKEI